MFDIETQSSNYHSNDSSSDFNSILDSISNQPLQSTDLLRLNNNLAHAQTIAFIDSRVSDVTNLTENLQADIKVILDPTQDGLQQISNILKQYNNLSGVHIISHGNTAELQLGNSFINSSSLNEHQKEVQQWGSSLTAEADILLYGCQIAAGEEGQTFVDSLSSLTDADIAASVDLTGNASQGGDWQLEYSTGNIETEIPFTDSFTNEYEGILPTLFTTQTPAQTNETDGSGSAGDYELGMEFRSSQAGQISAIRYYKAPSETGTHVGRIWSSNGTLLGSVTFTNETASGWQQQALTTPISIAANTTYVVSVNTNTHYAVTTNGLANTITNGDLSAVADGSNGVFNTTPANFPTQSFQNSNYFRDVVFSPNQTPNNTPGTVAISGTATQNQVLTANVTDTDGLPSTINYQWQQSSNNGTTWTNLAGATNQTFTLGQTQVNNQIRVTATYTDNLGSGENATSTATTSVVNVNDVGTATLSGTAAQGGTLTANIADADGLPNTISYQWQQRNDSTAAWTNITGATNQNLALDSSLVGKQVRVNAIYTDSLGGNENIFSAASNSISSVALENLFGNQTPAQTNATDGSGSAGDYELGTEFRSSQAGQISAIRYYKAPSETGTHVGRIWSSNGTLLGSVTFTNETASGWQQQALTTPINIAANTTYVVSVNTNSHYAFTPNGLATTITNGNLSAVADGSNGVFNTNPANFPAQSFQNANYFRDVVFSINAPNSNNNAGIATISGTATQNQVLTANVTDTDGLPSTINYQWQQSIDNGTTWTNISGATNQTFTLGQAQVNNQIRVRASYTDSLGNNENATSTATTSVVNVNDVGTATISGTAAQGGTLTANITDADGLPNTISYQWQQRNNSTASWTNITGATNQNLALDSSLVGKQVRVNAIYTDSLGGNENIFSAASNSISSVALESIFTTQTPAQTNETDGSGSAGDYELGTEFRSSQAGQISAIRYYKAPSETGTHVGRIWSSTGTLLGSVTFTNETASGWQQQALTTPINIAANTTYVVSVNTNSHYVVTTNGLANTITNGNLSAVADGSNGVFNITPANFPTQSFQNSNYFRDVVFTSNSPSNNNPGAVSISGTVTENQTLTANVTDTDGLPSTINYQWQQSSDNGTTWTNISGATNQTFTLGDAQVNKRIRVRANYVDVLGSSENTTSISTSSVANVNDIGLSILAGSATVGRNLVANILDNDGLNGVTINYQWQQLANNVWTNISGATAKTFTLASSFLNQQIRATATYIDALGSSENISSSGVSIAAQNAIVLENQKTGTRNWEISNTNLATNNEIAGYGDATSINKGGTINLKVSLAQAGQYRLDVYRLGFYGGTGGRLVTSVTGLNGVSQAAPTITNTNTRLVEYNWNTSYALQTGSDWTSGLYFVKLTDNRTGKQSYIQFVLRDDNRPAEIGFQDAITTAAAYNNAGGYSVYDFNSNGGQRAYQVSFDRPFQYGGSSGSENFNNTLTWEYNMTRWVESQGYDVSYYSNLDVHTNPLQLYSQKVFLSTGHDEYWSMAMRDNVELARDRGINLAFFSANTAYWQVRFDPSSSGQSNRVMTVYKDSSGIGSGASIDPIAQTNPAAATTLFRSSEVNRPENALIGVGYTGDIGSSGVYQGFDFVVSNASDPYYANTGLQNGDRLTALVGYEWDSVLNNAFTPAGLVVLSSSPVPSSGLIGLGIVPPGTDDTRANAVRYTAASGAKVFATGSVQWVWGLDSDRVPNPRADIRAQQIAVNVFKDMGAIPLTPLPGLVV